MTTRTLAVSELRDFHSQGCLVMSEERNRNLKEFLGKHPVSRACGIILPSMCDIVWVENIRLWERSMGSQVILERFLWRWVLSWDRVTIEFGWVQDKPSQVGRWIRHKPSQKSRRFFLLSLNMHVSLQSILCVCLSFI